MADEPTRAPLPHLIVPGQPRGEAFTPPGGGRTPPPFPIPNRRAHAEALRDSLAHAVEAASDGQSSWSPEIRASGFILAVDGWPGGVELALESLDLRRSGIELLGVHPATEGGTPEAALVFIPNDKVDLFFRRLDQYAEQETRTGRPRNERLVANLAAWRLATLEQLWTDQAPFPATDEPLWWEIWLRRNGHELDDFMHVAEQLNWDTASTAVEFPGRTITAVRATRDSLGEALGTRVPFAELRSPRLVESPAQLAPQEQRQWTEDLVGRLRTADPDAPAVCLLDTGIYRHSLFAGSLDTQDIHNVVGPDGVDRHGHGTEQAGLALFGDLADPLTSRQAVTLRHRLESVKFLPDPEAPPNSPETYAAVTASGVARPEAARPNRRRVYCVATTASFRSDGRPTSWSAALDALAFGTDIEQIPSGLELLSDPDPNSGRLLVVAGGNIEGGYRRDHLVLSDAEPIQDPGQAWNALTVGAFTDLDGVPGAVPHAGWTAIAPRGELSPFSRTSLTFQDRWPAKPDIVLEGGNVLISPRGTDTDLAETVSLTTTSKQEPYGRSFTTTSGTSPAAAQASRLAALVAAGYPQLWPETIRGLLIHAAEWTEPMIAQLVSPRGRAARRLVRRYGFGVPTEERVLQSAASNVTLVSQAHIQPFEMTPAGTARLREMHVHELPWPRDQLLGLGATSVRLRVTLSYFIEPNPSSRGWKGRYAYASHGLRFDVRRPGERTQDFRARLNRAAEAEEAGATTRTGQEPAWLFGSQMRRGGSLHADIWTGSAAELADCGVVGVYPVGGWWKNNNRRDRAQLGVRYALVVSLSTPAVGIDLYTPIAAQIGIAIAIET